MTDYHVHIGQFGSAYYYADRVFAALKAQGVDEVYFSSTTSCLYCKERDAARNDSALCEKAPTARALYEGVRGEVEDALRAAAELDINAHALYWVVPDVHFAQAGVTVEQAMAEVPYAGFKIHPRAQKWNLCDKRTASLAEEVFSYAASHKKSILIHADDDDMCSPRLFEALLARYPQVSVQLAHLRPLSDALYMLRTYPNVCCDTAMANADAVAAVQDAGFADRLRPGSDFPIPHWRSVHPQFDPTADDLISFLRRSGTFLF